MVREIVWIRKLKESRTFQKSNCIAQEKGVPELGRKHGKDSIRA